MKRWIDDEIVPFVEEGFGEEDAGRIKDALQKWMNYGPDRWFDLLMAEDNEIENAEELAVVKELEKYGLIEREALNLR